MVMSNGLLTGHLNGQSNSSSTVMPNETHKQPYVAQRQVNGSRFTRRIGRLLGQIDCVVVTSAQGLQKVIRAEMVPLLAEAQQLNRDLGAVALAAVVGMADGRQPVPPPPSAGQPAPMAKFTAQGLATTPQALVAEIGAMWQEFRVGSAGAAEMAAQRDMSLVGFIKYTITYWSPYWRTVVVIVPSLLAFRIYQTAFALSLRTIVDSMVIATGAPTIIFILVGLAVGFPVIAAAYILGQRLTANVSANILNDIRFKLFAHLQQLSISFYKNNVTGNILSRFSSDIDQIEKGVTRKAMDGLITFLALGINIPVLFLLDWRLAAISVAVIPLTSALLERVVPWSAYTTYQLQREKAKTVTIVQENISAQMVVKGYAYQNPMISLFQGRLDELRGKSVESTFSSAMVESLSILSLLFSQLVVTCAGGIFAIYGIMSPGSLVAYLSLLAVTHRELYDFAKRIIPNMISAIGGIQRIEDLLRELPQVTDAPHALDLPAFQREIRFDRVGFSYTGQQQQLKQLSLTIGAGRYVAIVGPSGAGKSTILNLLMRFYDINSGSISLDGHDLRAVTQDSLRAQIGVVFQEAFLFNTSIRDNIRVAKLDATDEEVMAAAKAAEIHDFIMTLPAGYDTLVGERGGRLSGGQQQRISIARAMLRNPAILLLDEATSALDLETEAAITATIESLAVGRTIIFVTHRLRTIVRADQIFVLEAGDVVECGTHPELLAHEGLYHRMWYTQDTVRGLH